MTDFVGSISDMLVAIKKGADGQRDALRKGVSDSEALAIIERRSFNNMAYYRGGETEDFAFIASLTGNSFTINNPFRMTEKGDSMKERVALLEVLLPQIKSFATDNGIGTVEVTGIPVNPKSKADGKARQDLFQSQGFQFDKERDAFIYHART